MGKGNNGLGRAMNIPEALIDESFGGENDGTSFTLIESARRGDPDAWNRFVELYTPLAYRNLRRLGLCEDDASELWHEAFMQVKLKISKFDPEHSRASFRGWLATIVRNKALDKFRKDQKRERAIGGTDIQQRIQQEPDRASGFLAAIEQESDFFETKSDDRVLMETAIAQIQKSVSKTTFTAFYQMVTTDRSSSDIGEELGLTGNNVRQSAKRVKDKIRQLVNDVPSRR